MFRRKFAEIILNWLHASRVSKPSLAGPRRTRPSRVLSQASGGDRAGRANPMPSNLLSVPKIFVPGHLTVEDPFVFMPRRYQTL